MVSLTIGLNEPAAVTPHFLTSSRPAFCYLGSLDEGNLGKLWLRVDFWDHIGPKLDQLGLTRLERARIEESIERVIPRVPDAEVAVFKKERQALREESAQLFRMFKVMRYLRS